MIPEGFDWQFDDSVVVNYQPALAVYRNTMDSVVIRQERSEPEDEDTIVIITPENAQNVANAILRVAREIIGEPEPSIRRTPACRRPGGIDVSAADGVVRQITDQGSLGGAQLAGQLDAFNGHAA